MTEEKPLLIRFINSHCLNQFFIKHFLKTLTIEMRAKCNYVIKNNRSIIIKINVCNTATIILMQCMFFNC